MTIWGGVNRFLVKTRGAILTEFAFCVPVLFILILYIYDATLMSRYYKQTEQVACQIINMLQNVSQKRNDKRITKTDLQNILIAAYLTIYPDTAFSSLAGGHKYGHFPEIFMYYVKGNDDGSASVVWGIIIHLWNYNVVLDTPNKVRVDKRESSNGRSRINMKQNVSPNLIFDKLQIEKGETKIIIESCLSYSRNSRYFWGNGTSCSKISERQAFGFNLISPKAYTRSGTQDSAYFHSTVIFTPKTGLFDENATL